VSELSGEPEDRGLGHHDHQPVDHQHPYDLPYHWTMGRFYRYVVEVAAQRVAPIVRGRSVLEMGCGDGYMTAQVAREARSILGFDLNERAIAFAKMIVRDANVSFEVGRAENLAAIAESMDEAPQVVASFEVVEHLSEDERAAFLDAARAVLIDGGGPLILTTPNGSLRAGHRMNPHHSHEFAPDELVALLTSRGFVDVRIQGLYLQPPWPDRLEHFADTVPFRALFHRLARAGAGCPAACRTLICVGRAG
jgi:SAM-dependent methyltransferase